MKRIVVENDPSAGNSRPVVYAIFSENATINGKRIIVDRDTYTNGSESTYVLASGPLLNSKRIALENDPLEWGDSTTASSNVRIG